MRKLIRLFIDYLRQHFDVRLYGLFALFMAICILVNYHFDFENSIVDQPKGTPLHFFYMFLFHAFPFLMVGLFIQLIRKDFNAFSSWHFWLVFLLGMGILAFDRTSALQPFKNMDLGYDSRVYLFKVSSWGSSLVTVLIPLLIINRLIGSHRLIKNYGLKGPVDWPPYFQLLGIVIIIIGIGSFFPDVQAYYPRFTQSRYLSFATETGWPPYLAIGLYELVYGLDFISVELMFRGFLVLAFVRYFGAQAILPMVATYAFLHFGKPATEAVSSIFGGFALGILAFRTHNIWGGVLIHISIAWCMELFGFLHKI